MDHIFSEMLENGCSIRFKYDSCTETVYTQNSLIPLDRIDSHRDISACIGLILDRFVIPQIKEDNNG